MVYSVEDIKRDVRIALDQNNSSDALIETGDIDTLTLEEIIESKIEDAARIVSRDIARHLLDGGRSFGESIGWDSSEGYGSGFVPLPSDFLRLLSFQMSDWAYPVTSAITEDNPMYPLQHSEFGGVRGNWQKPVVAIVNRSVTIDSQEKEGLILEFYSCSAGAGTRIKTARYIPMPKIENGSITLYGNVRPAVIYYTAYLVALSIEANDLAVVLLNVSKELMQ